MRPSPTDDGNCRRELPGWVADPSMSEKSCPVTDGLRQTETYCDWSPTTSSQNKMRADCHDLCGRYWLSKVGENEIKLCTELIHSIVELNLPLPYLPHIPMDRAGSHKKPGKRRKNILSCHRSIHLKSGGCLNWNWQALIWMEAEYGPRGRRPKNFAVQPKD